MKIIKLREKCNNIPTTEVVEARTIKKRPVTSQKQKPVLIRTSADGRSFRTYLRDSRESLSDYG